MNKQLSCGAYIFDENNKMLIVKPRYDIWYWGIPKGVLDAGEAPRACMTREVYEETNIKIQPDEIIQDMGKMEYLPNKDLYLFHVVLEKRPTNLQCNSFFQLDGKTTPEVVEFKWVDFDECPKYFQKVMRSVHSNVASIILK